jgi:enterochelin esterase-like enzyme
MSLLGAPLLWLLGALTVAVPVAVCVLWSRVRGPRPVRIISRLVMIGAAQLVALCLTAAAINDYGYFYGSWSELAAGVRQFVGGAAPAARPDPARPSTGAVPSPGTGVGSARVSAASAGSLLSRPYPSFSAAAQWASRGRIESVTIRGGISGLRSHAFVYLPPQYFQPAYAHTWFPAAEVFTGYPGDDLNLISRMGYQNVLRRLLAQHRARPMILVLLRPSVTFPRDTECTNVPAGPQAETFFAADVPVQVAAHYRARATGWGAVGDSTGGYCATKLAMLNPGAFPAAVSLSGYYFALHDRTTGSLWGGSSVLRDLNDLHWRLTHLPAPAVSVLVCTSPAELGADGYAEARRFVAEVHAPMVADLLTVPHGGHNFATWDEELPGALSWLSGKLPAPGAGPDVAASGAGGSAQVHTGTSGGGR